LGFEIGRIVTPRTGNANPKLWKGAFFQRAFYLISPQVCGNLSGEQAFPRLGGGDELTW
jgi:hypothetical protein